MSHITIDNVATLAAYAGPHAIPGIRFRSAREPLGVSAWGMNVLELDANNQGYPEHDHVADGQEELYVVLDGSAVLIADGQERVVVRGDMVRVAPAIRRKFVTRDSSVRMLAIGGTPGKAYTPSGL
jgi:uncharacterized cupin superfamily protein